jgi:hypothetical protein
MKPVEKINNYVESVKTRSEEEKRRVAITWTIVITILIFIVWAITFSLSIVNRQVEDERLRTEALARAKKVSEASTTVGLVLPQDSWSVKLRGILTDGADSVSQGFWTVGSWLHK